MNKKTKTKIIKVRPDNFTPDELYEAGEIIKRGGLVAFPTETVYGLGANALLDTAVKKIYEAKGRPGNNPLIAHISRPEEASLYCETDDRYNMLAKAFMPGPLTVIMKSRGVAAPAVSAGLGTLAVRCPENPIARALIEKSGVPVAAPSANLSGRPSPTTAERVIEDLDGRVDMIIDGGECTVGLESTIVLLDTDKAVLLRPGFITYEELSAVLGSVVISDAVTGKLKEGERPLSPGMMYRHYAPAAPLYLVRSGNSKKRCAFMRERIEKNENTVILCYEGELEGERVISLGKTNDPAEQAHRLFEALRRADELKAGEIYAPYPDKEGIGLALLNRMLRASAYNVIDI